MFCPECGQQNREDHNFCQHCGAGLSTSRSTVVRRSRRKALLISIVAIVVIFSSVFYFFFAMGKGICGTYIFQDPQQPVQVFIELKEDNTVFQGFSFRWKVEANKIVFITETDSAEVHIEGDRIIGKTGVTDVTGSVVSEIGKRDGAKPIKSSQGRLWSAYFDQRSGLLIEFKEDGIVKEGYLGKYESKGDTLTLYFKNPKGKEESIKCKITGNTITLNKMVFVKYKV
jgi:hypothetical protein